MKTAPIDLNSSGSTDDPAKAGKSLEAYFLRQVLSEVRKSTVSSGQKSMFDGGFAGDTFKEMFDGALADAMAGTAGIAKMVEANLEKSQNATPATKPATHQPIPLSKSHASIPVSDAHAHKAYSLAAGNNVNKALKETETVPNQKLEASHAR